MSDGSSAFQDRPVPSASETAVLGNEHDRQEQVAGWSIRLARVQDAPALGELSEQLGYPVAVEELKRRLEQVLPLSSDVVYVAQDDTSVVGWIHGARQDLLESEPRCEILGLVVHRGHRRRGIASALVLAVERWAADRGLRLLSVRSAVGRDESHPFYERLGYERVKTQHVYRKTIS